MTVKDTLIISFYRFVVAPLSLTALVFFVLPFNKKVRGFLKQKFRPNARFSKNCFWFHSSSGEFEYCKPLIQSLNQNYPDEKCFASYSSTSYRQSIQKFPGIDGHSPLPLDLPGPVSQFLNKIQPKILLIAKTDLWPELIFQTWLRKIPIVVFAKVAKPKSPIFSWLQCWMYNKCSLILCMSEVDAQNLRDLGVTTPIQVTGDPRIDWILQRVHTPLREISEEIKHRFPVLIMGSSWPQDEAVVLPAVLPLVREDHLQLIVAPHEPSQNHFESLQKIFLSYGVTAKKYSQMQQWTPKEILYVDVMGILADLYQLSQIAFIGGSFRSQVHNVAEALGHGNYVLVGPKNQNSREAQVFKNIKVDEASCVTEAHDTKKVLSAINSFLENPESLKTSRPKIQQELQSLSGATDKTIQAILTLVKDQRI